MVLPDDPPSDRRPATASVDPLVRRYLEHVRVEKRLAERTVALYTLDLVLSLIHI